MSSSASIAGIFAEDEPLTVVDRSTLENYCICPARARYIETGLANDHSSFASIGDAVHDALGETIRDYVASGGSLTGLDLQEAATAYLLKSQPDVQPGALAAAQASLYHWSRYIGGIHHENFLRWDGGPGEHSGQLAWDMPDLGLRITSEIDFLHATESIELVREIDWKSGRKFYRSQDVAECFQFNLHAWLILKHYENIRGVEIIVWNTRVNRQTYRVEFTRSKLAQLDARVRTVAENYWHYHKIAPYDSPIWPIVEKCRTCPAAALCPASGQDAAQLAANPGDYIDQLVALSAKVKEMTVLAGEYVKSAGHDIVSANGNCFGVEKPKKEQKPKTGLYQISPIEDNNGEEGTADAE